MYYVSWDRNPFTFVWINFSNIAGVLISVGCDGIRVTEYAASLINTSFSCCNSIMTAFKKHQNSKLSQSPLKTTQGLQISHDILQNKTMGGLCFIITGSLWWLPAGPRFNIKMTSYQYMKSHCGDKTVVRSSYLHNGISYTGKMSSLYWIGSKIPFTKVSDAELWFLSFDIRPSKLLSKQSRHRWFETISRSSGRHCNDTNHACPCVITVVHKLLISQVLYFAGTHRNLFSRNPFIQC